MANKFNTLQSSEMNSHVYALAWAAHPLIELRQLPRVPCKLEHRILIPSPASECTRHKVVAAPWAFLSIAAAASDHFPRLTHYMDDPAEGDRWWQWQKWGGNGCSVPLPLPLITSCR